MKPLHRPSWIVVHTQASPDGSHGTVESIREYHVEDRGFEDIGYHVVVDAAGRARPGRSVRYQGAGVEGFNARSLHVCCTGNGDLAPFTPAQLRGLLGVVRGWMEEYSLSVERVLGHRECYGIPGVPNTGKTCPGRLVNMHAIRAALAAPVEAVIPGVPPKITLPPRSAAPAAPTTPPNLERIEIPRREHVAEILRVRRISPEVARAGLQVAEALLRGVLRGQPVGRREVVKAAADALSEFINDPAR